MPAAEHRPPLAMFFATLDLAARILVVVALVYASAVALTHWAVRSRRITPFGAWPRFMRRASDPVLLPLERRVVRAGGSPQDAPLWLVGIVDRRRAAAAEPGSLARRLRGHSDGRWPVAGPRAWARFLLSGLFTLLMVALFVRVISSWFGISPYRPWMRPVMLLTDWLIEPIRRILPPFGMIDFSPLVAWLVLSLAPELRAVAAADRGDPVTERPLATRVAPDGLGFTGPTISFVAICAACGHVKQPLKRIPSRRFGLQGLFRPRRPVLADHAPAAIVAQPTRAGAGSPCSSRCWPGGSWCSTAPWAR